AVMRPSVSRPGELVPVRRLLGHERRGVRVGLVRGLRLGLDAGTEADRRFADGIAIAGPWAASADHQQDARLVARADEDVRGARRTMDEVPRLQLPLLAFDDQRARAREDDEVLLRRFTVVHRGGVAPAEDADVDADLVEAVLAIL